MRASDGGAWLGSMCNLYSMNKTREEVVQLVKALRDLNNNQPPLPGVFPDYAAPIVRLENSERIMANARWGLPSPTFALQGRNSDRGITWPARYFLTDVVRDCCMCDL